MKIYAYVLFWFCFSNVAMADIYTLTDIGPSQRNSRSDGIALRDVNDVNQVLSSLTSVGGLDGVSIWTADAGHQVILGTEVSDANRINNQGQVLAKRRSTGSFLWDPVTGEYSIPNNFVPREHTGLNNLGQVSGIVTNSERPGIWDPINGIQTPNTGLTGNLPARGINDFGALLIGDTLSPPMFTFDRHQVLHEVVPDRASFTIFGGVINNHDQVAFINGNSLEDSGLFWDPDSGLTSISDQTTDRFYVPWPKDLNDRGQIVGHYHEDDFSTIAGAFLWDAETGIQDLSDLLTSPWSGWTIIEAVGINNSGNIIANATNPEGARRAVLLTAVPEPSINSALFFALLTLLLVRSRTRIEVAAL